MKKGSKPPEERRKELLYTAARLFSWKGYESVSVRDILAEVGAADERVIDMHILTLSQQSRHKCGRYASKQQLLAWDIERIEDCRRKGVNYCRDI